NGDGAVIPMGAGIPPSTAKLIGYSKPVSSSNGLSKVGKLLVEWCLENGVILDLVHSTKETRQQVYTILEKRREKKLMDRPVIFSHSGVWELAAPNMTNESDKLILPDAEELKKIKSYKGVIGLILMNYWIIGIEEDNLFKRTNGLIHLIHTIQFIKDVLGDFENITFGTDLDGFTQVPDDLSHVRFLGRIREAIRENFGEAACSKICYENALRVIREGWA
ncbi:MAG: membrane dipeptidase, partial [Ginsengibacter sp.]